MSYRYQYSDQISLDWVIEKLPNFLFPNIAKKKDRISKLLNGVIATEDNKAVGLILASYGKSKDHARVHSFMVHPNYHSDGIGTDLLKHLEESLKAEGCQFLDGYYRSHWKSVPFLTQLLQSAGWSDPKEELLIVRGKAKRVLHLFMHDKIRLPEGYSFQPFADLTPAQRDHIRARKRDEDWYDDILDPFVNPSTMNPVASIVLMQGDEVLGWVISHQIAETLNEFTALFIDEKVRSFKMAHLLMRETIMLQDQMGIENFLITSKVNNYVMSRFLLRHIEETGVFFTKTMYCSKKLGEATS